MQFHVKACRTFLWYNLLILTQIHTMNTPEEQKIQWQGQMHVEHERTTLWYIGAVLALLALIAFSIVTASWSFLAVIILASILYVYIQNKHIPSKTVTITKDALIYGDKIIHWNECAYFWMIKYHSHYELHLKLNSRWKDDFRVQTGTADPNQIREFISQYLPENTEHHEKKLDMIARLLKI